MSEFCYIPKDMLDSRAWAELSFRASAYIIDLYAQFGSEDIFSIVDSAGGWLYRYVDSEAIAELLESGLLIDAGDGKYEFLHSSKEAHDNEVENGQG